MTENDAYVAEYDSPWKTALENYFEQFMFFFFPNIHAEIDWSKGYEFKDTELARIVRDATLGRRYADRLVKVFLLDGDEAWLLIHIEIQGYVDNTFEKRMFVYNYRISDVNDVEVVSLAVLSDDDPNYRPGRYRTGRWGCELNFSFPAVKVLDYGKDWEKLEQDQNPFAMVVMAHLKAREVKDGQERKRWKLHLVRLLYEKGYEKQDILDLLRF
ncbi:MAG: cytosolic protein, partial [Proteobacteria bacterium]|nr:cytosolic protein [Pseudomonadota bacterium]